MKMYLVVAVVLALGLVFSVSGVSLAQEEEETEYSWGAIVGSVSSNQIVVNEFDYDTEENIDVVYTLDPKMELKNVNLLKDIAVGDNVDIEYVVINDKKVAKAITVEKAPGVVEQEEAPSETYEEEWEWPS